MMGVCTWEGCWDGATFIEVAKDGKQWAKLCIAHHNQLEETIKAGKAPAIMSAWIKAQGSAKKAAERM